jgi:hypothetical protein
MNYRPLSEEEVQSLLSQGCSAENWGQIHVVDSFSPAHIHNTRFEGEVRLGNLYGKIRDRRNNDRTCGIYNSNIKNSVIGDKICISYVKNLSNYVIHDNVIIENVGTLSADVNSGFGNGTLVNVLNEAGGRELPIFDRLSAQIAYLTVLYRHDKEFTEKILEVIKEYCDSKRAGQCVIHSGTEIRDSLIIRNVEAGSFSGISGACLLEDGTIGSCIEDPAFIGEGVIAKRFIMLSGSTVDGGAIIDKCFIGQGVKIGKQFSAENSVFFANSEAFHGEACSYFGGPYSVTHHKSTLMIATMSSFFNAGSGTNQSNHMYKLGPVHQGILARGCKTGSFAYLRLPGNIGPFTVVMGKHNANFDTSEFPFSYISEDKGRSELTPALNLFTVGTRRDSEKWPKRDRRKDPGKLDLIHFDLLGPYVMCRVISALDRLKVLTEQTPSTQDLVNYKGIYIHRLLFRTARKYYEMALKVYMGQELIRRISGLPEKSTLTLIREKLKIGSDEGKGNWVDICGLYAPSKAIGRIIDHVKSGKLKSIAAINENLGDIYKNYERYAWEWCYDLISTQIGNSLDKVTGAQLIEIINAWKINAIKLNNMILQDAEKEFESGSRIGFGIDGDDQARDTDFVNVRGSYENNSFVAGLRKESEDIESRAADLIRMVENSGK